VSNTSWLWDGRAARDAGGVELRELRCLLALAEERTFTRAAARCHVSQQAFSRTIAQLERRAGDLLVERRPRGCALTEAGERLVARARPLVAAADALLAPPEPAVRVDDALRLGLMLDGAGAATATMLAAWRRAHPDRPVRVRRLHADRVVDALLDGTVDAALLHGPVHDERLELLPLFTEPRIAALSPATALADAPVLRAADLLDQPARARRDRVREDWEGFFTLVPERNGEQPRRSGDPAGSLEELLYAIGLDRLVLTMPAHLARTYPADLYGVRYVPVPDLPPVVFALAHRRSPPAPVLAFRESAQRSVAAHALTAPPR
jgi:DNA-binding transcriptional LysR family regulator